MGLPNISIMTYVYLLSKALPLGLILFLTIVTIFLTFFIAIMYVKKNFNFSPYFAIVPVVVILALTYFSYQSLSSFSAEFNEIWNEETVTEIVTIKAISKQTPVINNEEIKTNNGNLLNIRNEWYFKKGKKYEVTYYKTSKVIADVNKVDKETYK